MHIGMILPYLERGGTERHGLTLTRGLLEHHRVTLVAPPGPALSAFADAGVAHIPFQRFDHGFIAGWRSFRGAMRDLGRRDLPDVLHVHAAHELLLALPRDVNRCGRVFTVHGYHGSNRSISYKTAAWAANRRADQSIAVSEYEHRTMLAHGFAQAKVNLIHNGIDDPCAADCGNDEASNTRSFFVIGTVARLEAAKGIDRLIRAVPLLESALENGAGFEVVIVGTGRLAGELEALAVQLGVADRVRFTGFVPDAAAMMAGFDVFVLPALEEPFGLVCAEAMANRVPVVASRVGGIPEVVADGETGLLVEPGREDLLASALEGLFGDLNRRRAMGEAGRRRFLTHFTSREMVDKTVEVYDKVCRG